MKRFSILAALLVFLLPALLTACGKSEFGAIDNTGKRIVINAEKADKDAFFMTGTLEAKDGEQIELSADLSKGSVRLEVYEAPQSGNADELVLDGEAILTANLKLTDKLVGTVPAGSYMVKAICLEKATGTVVAEVKPAS